MGLGIGLVCPQWLPQTLTIAVAGGVISVLALLPGLLMGVEVKSTGGRAMTFMVACLAAMMIRMLGTVALLVACRYQMSLPTIMMVALVCGTYVFLTAVEIHLLVRSASKLGVDRSNLVSTSIDQSRVLPGQYLGES
ncbi:MAG: hypothetical protein MI861_19700 [Pirellulales bacterium]|nr:hypothetical protein [Pirellulales bacterium]